MSGALGMGSFGDILEVLGHDISAFILSYLDDPADIVRASSVSRSWHQFVIGNDFCKKLCLKLFPDVTSAVHAIEVDDMIESEKVGSSDSKVLGKLEKNHTTFAILARGLSPVLRNDCIAEAISATSTDNYPEESIHNTLESRDIIEEGASYWSSRGECDDGVPEILIYKLISGLCFVTEFSIQPFQAYFQYGFPIYSPKSVRFRVGHFLKGYPALPGLDPLDANDIDDYYEWTYVSPEFPMVQENCLQKFKLPKAVLCIGGFLAVELLGRVQRQEMDNLFYICLSHVEAVGRTLLPEFSVEFLDQPGKCVVKYCPEGDNCTSSEKGDDDVPGESSQLNTFTARLMRRAGGWERVVLNTLLWNVVDSDNDSDNDSDEEFVA